MSQPNPLVSLNQQVQYLTERGYTYEQAAALHKQHGLHFTWPLLKVWKQRAILAGRRQQEGQRRGGARRVLRALAVRPLRTDQIQPPTTAIATFPWGLDFIIGRGGKIPALVAGSWIA